MLHPKHNPLYPLSSIFFCEILMRWGKYWSFFIAIGPMTYMHHGELNPLLDEISKILAPHVINHHMIMYLIFHVCILNDVWQVAKTKTSEELGQQLSYIWPFKRGKRIPLSYLVFDLLVVESTHIGEHALVFSLVIHCWILPLMKDD